MRLATLRTLLSNRDYAIYSAGNAVSLTGTWIHHIAFAWVAWEMTRSLFWLGVLGAVGLVPTLLGGLVGGVLADRLDRLRLTIFTQVLCFVLSLSLFVLYELDALTIWLLLAFKAMKAGAVSLSQPARMALIPNLVGPGMIGPAVSFGSMVFNTARFLGPAIAGMIIAVAGIGPAFLVNALTYLAMAAAILSLRHVDTTAMHATAGGGVRGFAGQIAGGFRYLRGHPGGRTLFVLLITVVIAARPISEFLPAIVEQGFARSVDSVAILISSMAAGSMLGGLWMAGRDAPELTMPALRATFVYAGCLIAFLLVDDFWLACGLFAASGFFTSVFATAAQTLIQVSIEDGMRGRVMSLWFIVMRGGPDMGALVMGIGGALVGLSNVFVLGALLCVAVNLWVLRRAALVKAMVEVPAGTPR